MGARRVSVVVLEEDEGLRCLFREILADGGFRVSFVREPRELSRRWKGDVVLSDSGGVAYERAAVERRVRLLRERSDARIVLVSAHSEVERDAALLGADAVLRKPFHIEELLSLIRSITAR